LSGRRFFVLRARSQTQRTGHDGHDHDCFEDFQLVIRLLSLLVAARHLGSYDQTRNAFLDFFPGRAPWDHIGGITIFTKAAT
jgi:hypothetical protein